MSQADVERFVEDLKKSEELRNELAGHASGVESVVAFAAGKGYAVTAEEVGAHASAQARRDLSDDELDALAGGLGLDAPVGGLGMYHSAALAAEAVVVSTTGSGAVGGQVMTRALSL